jgi:general secretion pathway protein G
LELLVVVLIIGLLTSIVGPRFMAQINRSEATAARAQIDAFNKALHAYRIDVGRYPTSGEGLRALVEAGSAGNRWRGPYLDGVVPVDPWGTAYHYASPGHDGRDYELVSYGQDRAPGGTGDGADIGQ